MARKLRMKNSQQRDFDCENCSHYLYDCHNGIIYDEYSEVIHNGLGNNSLYISCILNQNQDKLKSHNLHKERKANQRRNNRKNKRKMAEIYEIFNSNYMHRYYTPINKHKKDNGDTYYTRRNLRMSEVAFVVNKANKQQRQFQKNILKDISRNPELYYYMEDGGNDVLNYSRNSHKKTRTVSEAIWKWY